MIKFAHSTTVTLLGHLDPPLLADVAPSSSTRLPCFPPAHSPHLISTHSMTRSARASTSKQTYVEPDSDSSASNESDDEGGASTAEQRNGGKASNARE